ncbi:hypothetical protein [Klebsiella pneumoniae]|uniref:hypothetical protein n=1 Tax=Klebsiella pneumoniae TaxID=573 RepID=UPI0029494272|nr:hypothetical protein [Klebsiella pneumoniae]MDV5312344.1 hypothetical protein [Klebsiella pneumoniae]
MALATNCGPRIFSGNGGRSGPATGNASLPEYHEATTLPVSADLEKGTGDSPDLLAKPLKLQLLDLRAVPYEITQADQKIPFLI